MSCSHFFNMCDKLQVLYSNNITWTFVPCDPSMSDNIGCKWVFNSKLNAEGSLDRLKACLVAKGFYQIDSINYLENFSLVI